MPLDLKSRSPATQRSHPWTSGSAGEKPWGYAASSWSPAPFLHTHRCSWGPAPSLHTSCYSWGPAPSLHTPLSSERMLAQTDAAGRVEHPHLITHREPATPTSRTAPSDLLGGRTEDLGLAQTWPLPSLRALGEAAGAASIHPGGGSLPPSVRSALRSITDPGSRRGVRRPGPSQPIVEPVGAEATHCAARLWDLGPRLPSWADLIWAAKSWGQWPRGTRV